MEKTMERKVGTISRGIRCPIIREDVISSFANELCHLKPKMQSLKAVMKSETETLLL